MSPNAGGGVAGVSADEYSCAHGAQINFEECLLLCPVPEFIDPRFRENKPKTLVFSLRTPAFWACFRENRVYNFRHCC
jgi:hypothetical protein